MCLGAAQQHTVPIFPHPVAGFWPDLSNSLSVLFQGAVCAATDEERMARMQDVIQQLPAPHYRSVLPSAC